MFRVLALLLLLAVPAMAQVGQGYSPAPGLSATGDASATTSLAIGGTASPATTNAARFAERIDVMADYNAKEDYISRKDGVTTSNSVVFTSASAHFSSADVGKIEWVAGAGAAGAVLVTTIASVNGATSVNLAAQATTAVSGATYGYGTDDTAAWAAAIGVANTRMGLGGYPCIYMPGGASFVNGSALPIFSGPGCVFGDGHSKSYVVLGPSYTGDTFSWSDAWLGPNWPNNSPVAAIGSSKAGPIVSGIGIIGNRLSSSQNGLVFYDRADLITISDVDASYLPGRAMYSGVEKNQPVAAIRESRIDGFRSFSAGATGIPAVEFWSQGAQFSTNEIAIGDMEIYGSYGPSLYFHTDATGGPMATISLARLRIEGIESNPGGAQGDLLKIGDPAATGIISGISFNHLELLDSYAGYCSMLITGGTGSLAPTFVVVLDGQMGGGAGAGNGLCINSGRSIYTHWSNIFVGGTGVIEGPASGGVGSPIVIDGGGGAQAWTWNIDASLTGSSSLHGAYSNGDPSTGSGTLGFSLQIPDGTLIGGNARGPGAVDLQTFRATVSQVASGNRSAVLGGIENAASGGQAATVGGSLLVAAGIDSMVAGTQATDRGRFSTNCFSSGAVVTFVIGSAQKCEQQLRNTATGATGIRMFADGTSAASSTNCVNIPDKTHYVVTVSLNALDHTTPTKSVGLVGWQIDMLRGTGAASTTVATASQPAALTNGTVTGWVLAATADTTQGCLNLTFTPPTGNTDTWSFVASVTSLEAQ